MQHATADYVGAAACANCHVVQYRLWQGSHHGKAMQQATASNVLAPFRGERFIHNGIVTTFSQRAGQYLVTTEASDGRTQTFPVAYTLGVTPLQQYLIPISNGGMQALTVAWDSRPKAQGGQRWFHLHADEHIRAGDPLHWTGRQNNWNFMCAECHTTQFKKNFDPQTQRYASTWSESNVACEACHGPGSHHLAWANLPAERRAKDSSRGLAQQLDAYQPGDWSLPSASANAHRVMPPQHGGQETELCARCHSHRSQISDDYVHGKPFLDTHVPSLLEPGLFWADGQMRAEVYNYVSFQQSRMAHMGVTCSDCHNPHTLTLRAPGDQTCLRCHAPTRYETTAHHHHATGSAGARCVACHMPTTTYMGVDPRHDHSIRLPRPDLSQELGTPNACSKCHTRRGTAWAADQSKRWYPQLGTRQRPLDQALVASTQGKPGAQALLESIAHDGTQPSVARASATARLANAAQLLPLLADPDPLVRKTAADAMAEAPEALRVRALIPLLADPVRAVRTSAARWLAGAPQEDWSSEAQRAWQTALNEYIGIQRFNADRPESYNNLGMLYADLRDWRAAMTALQTAIAMDPEMVASSLNLADVYRAQGRENQAEALLQDVVRRHPDNAQAWHALGLSLIRQGRHIDALAALRRASALEPGNSQLANVLAIAQSGINTHPATASGPRR